MKKIDYVRPASLQEAVRAMQTPDVEAFAEIATGPQDEGGRAAMPAGPAAVLAGGTDLLGTLRERILPEAPEKLVSLRDSGLRYIRETEEEICIGAMTTLDDIARSESLQKTAKALAEAARQVASPQIRHMATIGGNLCQQPRCWYYRYQDDRFHCMRKGGSLCNAFTGNNTYHSIFGTMKPCGSACERQCPNHTPIPAYFERLRAGDMDGAAAMLLEANLLAPVMGRVCVHSCQEACSRGQFDESLSIREIERFTADHGLTHADRLLPGPPEATGKRVAILGAGAAGLSAAWHLVKAGHQAHVYDAQEETGGMLRYGIPAYRLPRQILDDITRILERYGTVFHMGCRLGEDISLQRLQESHDRILLCTGAWEAMQLGCPGEDLPGVYQGIHFLKAAAEHRGPDLTGRKVAVIGAGNTAMDAVRTALRLGATSADIISITDHDEIPASEEELQGALDEGARIHYLITAAAFLADDQGKLTGIRLQHTRPLPQGGGLPVPIEGAYEEMDVDCAIIAIGQRLRGDTKQMLQEAAERGIPIAGDCRTGARTAIEAIADGKEAARRISASLGYSLPDHAFRHPGQQTNFDPASLTASPQMTREERPVAQRTLYEEDRPNVPQARIIQETARCFDCGCAAVSPSDLAAAVIALDGICVTDRREIPAAEFFTAGVMTSTVLEEDEILQEIRLPRQGAGQVQVYRKFRLREAIDFPVMGLAGNIALDDAGRIRFARLVASGTAPVPHQLREAEEVLTGQIPDAKLARQAALISVKDAVPLQENAFKIQVLQAFVRRTVAQAIREKEEGRANV